MKLSKILACIVRLQYFFIIRFIIFTTFFQEPFNLQLKVFMNEVSQQSLIPVIRRCTFNWTINFSIYNLIIR